MIVNNIQPINICYNCVSMVSWPQRDFTRVLLQNINGGRSRDYNMAAPRRWQHMIFSVYGNSTIKEQLFIEKRRRTRESSSYYDICPGGMEVQHEVVVRCTLKSESCYIYIPCWCNVYFLSCVALCIRSYHVCKITNVLLKAIHKGVTHLSKFLLFEHSMNALFALNKLIVICIMCRFSVFFIFVAGIFNRTKDPQILKLMFGLRRHRERMCT